MAPNDMAPLPVDGEDIPLSDGTVATAYPRVESLPDGRLAVGYARNANPDYFVAGEWVVKTSGDGGRTWQECDDPALPLNWPADATRERHDRATRVLADGTWWSAGIGGWKLWPETERDRARVEGRFVTPTSPEPGHIGVGTNVLILRRSSDGGATWTHREIDLPTAGWTLGLPRDVTLDDGTIVFPIRQRTHDGARGHFLVVRITPGSPDKVRIHPVPRDVEGLIGSEAALAHLGGDRLVMLMRADAVRGGDGRLLSSWSEDGGRSWTFPIVTDLWGRPPHLTTLNDGRLLATYGHQRSPYGVVAALSEDGGETWASDRTMLVAADPTRPVDRSPVGYHPMTVQLGDGTLFTTYYVATADSTHACGRRWHLPW